MIPVAPLSALSREAGEFGDGLVKGVGDALAEEAHERRLSRGGAVADAVGVGRDARLDHIEELSGSCRPAIGEQEPVEPAWPGREVGEPLGGDNAP